MFHHPHCAGFSPSHLIRLQEWCQLLRRAAKSKAKAKAKAKAAAQPGVDQATAKTPEELKAELSS